MPEARKVHTVIGWICPSLSMIALQVDRFAQVMAAGEKMHSEILNRTTTDPTITDDRPPAAHIKFIGTNPADNPS
jgi:hypothetical protein